MKNILEWVTHIKECNKVCSDMGLMLDDWLLNEQVYNQEDVMNALHLFFHIAGNYTTGEMIKQWCSFEFCEKQAIEFGRSMHELMLEYVKIDTRKYYNW